MLYIFVIWTFLVPFPLFLPGFTALQSTDIRDLRDKIPGGQSKFPVSKKKKKKEGNAYVIIC